MKRLALPLSLQDARYLRAGEEVLLSGVLYSARDAAHWHLCQLLEQKQPLPLELEGATIYYVGPTPSRPDKVVGSAGPTTSSRMDAFSPLLIEHGLRVMIGKGDRSRPVVEAMKQYGCVYLATIGGAGALIAKTIKQRRVLAWEELGCEALCELVVEDFPAIVAIDTKGCNLYSSIT